MSINSSENEFHILLVSKPEMPLIVFVSVFFSHSGLDLLDVADALKWAFLVLPNYCLGQGIGDMFNNYNALNFFNTAVETCVDEVQKLKMPVPNPRQWCERHIRELFGSTVEFQENYLAWHNPGIGRYLIFLAWEGVVFFVLVLLIEYGVFRTCRQFLVWGYCNLVGTANQEPALADDDDVLAEKERVMSAQDVLLIKQLTKVFPGNKRKF